jgi:tRNA threonylcarbamoyladenosine biosynthesis protein TsaB
MIVLAMDTCGTAGSVAIGRIENGEAAVLAHTELAAKTYSAQLVPVIRGLLEEQSLSAAALGALIVVNGPGSFTGVRIGVSTAKGLAEALGIPLVAISRLAVLAWKAGLEFAALDAGRGEFYFRGGSQESLLTSPEAPQFGSEPIAVCEARNQGTFANTLMVDCPTAVDALIFATPLLAAGKFADVETLDGNYLRRSDAEIAAKLAGKS